MLINILILIAILQRKFHKFGILLKHWNNKLTNVGNERVTIFFAFFNILTMKVSSYYKTVFGLWILRFLDYCIRRYCSFYLFHESRSVTFLSFFCFPAFQVYLCYCFITFWTKHIFLKIINSNYDCCIIYHHFVS